MLKWIERFNRLFVVWAVLICVVAARFPQHFAQLKPLIVPLLMVVMFGMGATLRARDFKEPLKRPHVILLGVSIQYLIMPLAAFLISRALGLSPELMVGMVLVGSVSGGTASNVVAFLAGGDVALSIVMTAASTFLAVFLTPLLTQLYVGATVPVAMLPMFLSILKIVVVPVAAGILVNTLFQEHLEKVQPVFPLISVVTIVGLIGIIIGLNQPRLSTLALPLTLAIILHNGCGLAAGYGLPKLLGLDEKTCRTIAIEAGMQNSGLAVALSIKYFTAASALPGAIFSLWHNLSGSFLATVWTTLDARKEKKEGCPVLTTE
ncbi:bile acid:sodium symporter family protein [Desulfoluna butyratoxydans]|uniref:Bile acid:sodium symporter/arsenical resistance protein acr3 n=1 Tax=Desulfoluna butyratoxydans TaxID=231438 RepID=A0A4U8YNA6_9BACT|nr:bile acid:sodium symporter family protein [Desulfoluna butyratoxydans]VFQ45575.1 bile acid:sodium symporter/arsenical resistance protein acr3 [Desulfoluna butyratoxydans]